MPGNSKQLSYGQKQGGFQDRFYENDPPRTNQSYPEDSRPAYRDYPHPDYPPHTDYPPRPDYPHPDYPGPDYPYQNRPGHHDVPNYPNYYDPYRVASQQGSGYSSSGYYGEHPTMGYSSVHSAVMPDGAGYQYPDNSGLDRGRSRSPTNEGHVRRGLTAHQDLDYRFQDRNSNLASTQGVGNSNLAPTQGDPNRSETSHGGSETMNKVLSLVKEMIPTIKEMTSTKDKTSSPKEMTSSTQEVTSSTKDMTSSTKEVTSSTKEVTSSTKDSASTAKESSPSVNCEIIISDPNQKPYAIKVASRLYTIGLKVMICTLPSEEKIMDELEDAIVRGCLFAVVIQDQHEKHNSVTVDILHGTPEEHRNMLFNDAMKLITQSYNDYQAEQKPGKISVPIPTPTSPKAKEATKAVKEEATKTVKEDFIRPDTHTRYLINLLAADSFLSLEELQKISEYLGRRMDKLKSNQSENVIKSSLSPSIDEAALKKQQELKEKIFRLLHGGRPESRAGPLASCGGQSESRGKTSDIQIPGLDRLTGSLSSRGGISDAQGGISDRSGILDRSGISDRSGILDVRSGISESRNKTSESRMTTVDIRSGGLSPHQGEILGRSSRGVTPTSRSVVSDSRSVVAESRSGYSDSRTVVTDSNFWNSESDAHSASADHRQSINAAADRDYRQSGGDFGGNYPSLR